MTRRPIATIAYRIEKASELAFRRFLAAAQSLDLATPVAALDVAGGVAAFFGAGSPNSLLRGAGLDGPVSAAECERGLRLYRERGDRLRVDTVPATHDSLLEWLRAKGATEVLRLVVLHRAVEPLAEAPSAGIVVREIGPSETATFDAVLGRGFGGGHTPEIAQALADMSRTTDRTRGVARFLAFLDGVPVGGGRVTTIDVPREVGGGRVAILQGAATLPEARRRGVQRALLGTRLARAGLAGCDTAVVTCEPGSASERNILRAGFVPAYEIQRWQVE